MNSVMVTYDIADKLKIANPSVYLRKYGVRANLSVWIFPGNCVPSGYLEQLQRQGAVVHIVEFAEQAHETILAIAREQIVKHYRSILKLVETRSESARKKLDDVWLNPEAHDKAYKHWRSVLSKARRELLSGEQCAMGFGITLDVDDAAAALKNVLSAELRLVLEYRDRQAFVGPPSPFVEKVA